MASNDKNQHPVGSRKNPVVKPASSQAGLQSAKVQLGSKDPKSGKK